MPVEPLAHRSAAAGLLMTDRSMAHRQSTEQCHSEPATALLQACKTEPKCSIWLPPQLKFAHRLIEVDPQHDAAAEHQERYANRNQAPPPGLPPLLGRLRLQLVDIVIGQLQAQASWAESYDVGTKPSRRPFDF